MTLSSHTAGQHGPRFFYALFETLRPESAAQPLLFF